MELNFFFVIMGMPYKVPKRPTESCSRNILPRSRLRVRRHHKSCVSVFLQLPVAGRKLLAACLSGLSHSEIFMSWKLRVHTVTLVS